MSNLIFTIKKEDNDPWITLNTVDANFSKAQKDSIITPFVQLISSLSGLVAGYPTYVTEGNTHTVTYQFDTLENLNNAVTILGTSSVVKAKNKLFSDTLTEKGIKYTSETTVE